MISGEGRREHSKTNRNQRHFKTTGVLIMESWRKVWREGFAPQLSTSGLEALRKALHEDDPRLIQGATTSPPPLQCVQDWPVDACCVLGFCSWQGEALETVA